MIVFVCICMQFCPCCHVTPCDPANCRKAVRFFFRACPNPWCRRMEPMKKAWFCAAGGFKVLRETLVTGKKTTCSTCGALLAEHQPNEEDLETQLRTDSSSAPWSDVQPAQPKDLSTKDVQPDQPEDAAPVDLDPFAFAKAQAPIIQLLPPGTFSKRFPYQCTICCSKKSPNGKVGELSEAKANTVKHFLQKHLLSTTHVNNLQKQKPILISENVKGEGLCISDASVAGHLYDYQAEFAMWCEFSNLEEHAKHEYWHAASESTWYVRSWNCQGEAVSGEAGVQQLPGAWKSSLHSQERGTFLQEVLCGRDACRKNVPRRRWDPRDKRSHCSRCCVPEFPKDHRWRPDFGCAQAPAICSGKLHLWL